ncbi:MAG TPA: heme biosynthesis HemY N-terminal domain-containing protein [Ferrovibrio sp.]|uniref:heme biosynthesis HemY N-terminal domain-containing protein n=1 Tax=Ferrovibrio sp. TaxID=1917215 RepID=UPI002ED076AF
MLRLVRAGLILAALMAAAGFAAWLADQPGRLRLDWFGYVIEMPAPLLALGIVLLASAIFVATWIVAWAAALPQRRRLKRQARGYAQFAAGMVAVAAGEAERAARLAEKAQGLLQDPALARLLAAHAAQLGGRQDAARAAFAGLSQDPGTAFLGYRGLLADARERGDRAAALQYAERASALRPGSPFAAEAELQLLVEGAQWDAAQARLTRARKAKAVSKPAAAQLSGRLILAQAEAALQRNEPRQARQLLDQAMRLLPDHPAPPVLLARAARLDSGNHAARETALQVLRRAWQRQPAEAYAEAWLGLQNAAAADRLLERARDFTAGQANADESRLLRAAAALKAHDFAAAREELGIVGSQSFGSWGERLMAQLAEHGDGDAAAADRWRARAAAHEGVWQCGRCGSGHAAWAPLCPQCGAFDSLNPTRLGETLPLAMPPRPLLPAERR